MQYLFILLALCMSLDSLALPTIYPINNNLDVVNTTNSNLVADDQNPNMFWVMPPTTGKSTVSNLHTLTANIGFCKEMSNLQTYSSNMVQLLNKVEMRRFEKESEVDQLENELIEMRLLLSNSVVTPIVEELMNLDEIIMDLDHKIAEILKEIQECTSNCRSLKTEYSRLSSLRNKHINERLSIKRNYRAETKNYLIAQEKIKSLEERILRVGEQLDRINDSFFKMHKTFLSMYETFGSLEGAKATVKFESKWDGNINTLKIDNPGLRFEKIETRNALLFTTANQLQGLPQIGAIISYLSSAKPNSEGYLEMASYPESFGGNILLSLFGTCPLLYPQDYQLPDGSVPQVEDMSFAVTATYEYPSVFTTKASISYNMYKMYERIQKSKSRGGGFFRSRKSTTSIQERNFFKDSFHVEWKDHIGLPENVKADMERDMRSGIFTRLAQIGLPAVINSGELKLPSLQKSGAIVLAEGLEKNCKQNSWCKGAALGSRVIEAIFGSAKATAHFKSVQDVKLKEEWSHTQIHWRPWVSSYLEESKIEE